jgi:hypothetical protein
MFVYDNNNKNAITFYRIDPSLGTLPATSNPMNPFIK